MTTIACRQIAVDVGAHLREPCAVDASVRISWLGQAGFCVSGAGLHLLIDPYLSDHLARKYHGHAFDHVRMMPAPLRPEQAGVVDYVLCTHRHGDHMDPEALPVILETSTGCRLVGPAAERDCICALMDNPQRTILVNDGDVIPLGPSAQVEVLASAHERLLTNEQGEHHFLGYIVQLGSLRIYHCGDCIPYPGLVERLRARRIHVALLPVNGRDAGRSSRGVPGNFTLDEAVDLFVRAEIAVMICHHFGMFRFNTVSTTRIQERIQLLDLGDRVLVPRVGTAYQFVCKDP
ncbi:MAG: MBL fold metallo-hydrolase [Phycisphaerae bacterium]|nr:MBL fold metallo-hydrolase [Phycisphaerae bacterium]